MPAQDAPTWMLAGEYCGVLDRPDGLDTCAMEDPLGPHLPQSLPEILDVLECNL